MEFLEIPLYDDDVFKLLVRFAINLIVVSAVILGCYRRHQQSEVYVFTFMLLNIMVFFICFALKKLELELGLALGLFAIFGIIRYRTEAISAHEMTYLFVVVGVAVINSLANKKTSYAEIAITNGIIIAAASILEQFFVSDPPKKQAKGKKAKDPKPNGQDRLLKQSIVYDNLRLLGPDQRADLIRDIEKRTGLTAQRIEVAKIDLPAGVANLTVFYQPGPLDEA